MEGWKKEGGKGIWKKGVEDEERWGEGLEALDVLRVKS